MTMGAGRGLWPRSCVVLTGSVLLSTMGGRLLKGCFLSDYRTIYKTIREKT